MTSQSVKDDRMFLLWGELKIPSEAYLLPTVILNSLKKEANLVWTSHPILDFWMLINIEQGRWGSFILLKSCHCMEGDDRVSAGYPAGHMFSHVFERCAVMVLLLQRTRRHSSIRFRSRKNIFAVWAGDEMYSVYWCTICELLKFIKTIMSSKFHGRWANKYYRTQLLCGRGADFHFATDGWSTVAFNIQIINAHLYSCHDNNSW